MKIKEILFYILMEYLNVFFVGFWLLLLGFDICFIERLVDLEWSCIVLGFFLLFY